MIGSSRETPGHAAWVIPAVLVACSSVSILSTDLFTPSLPHLPRLLASDAETVQLTVSLNLAAYAFAQLLHGPLSDRFGRRRLLLVGLSGFLVASLICAAAQSIAGLLAGRIAQGLFASVSSVVVILIIRELYDRRNAVRIMGYYGMAVGMAPALGPLLGGYIYVLVGWRMNFVLLIVLAAGAFLLVHRLLPETGARDHAAIHPRQIARGYLTLLGRRAYLRYLIPVALVFGALFAFVTAGPFLLIDRLGVATEDYGLYYGLLVLAFMTGSLTVSRRAGRVTADRLVQGAIFFACLGGAVLVAPLLVSHESLAAILLGMTLFAFGMGLILASGPSCLLDAAGDGPSGSASALLGSSQMTGASLAGLLVGSFHDGSAWPLALTIAGFTGMAALVYVGLRTHA
jgi:DHA1 family bicyclomycin/chloramphenicol resistance-like MFS transporter